MNREVSKIAKLGSLVVNEDELAKINKFTLSIPKRTCLSIKSL